MFLPDLGADEHPVDGEERAEQEGDGERAQHVPVEDVHADEIAYLDHSCHCDRSAMQFCMRNNFNVLPYFDIWPCSVANTLAAIHVRPMDEVTLKY